MIATKYIQSVAKAIKAGITPYAYKQMAIRKYGKTKGGQMADKYQREYYERKNKPSTEKPKAKPQEQKKKGKFHDPLPSYLKKEEEEIRKLEKEKKKKKKDDRELSRMFEERVNRWNR